MKKVLVIDDGHEMREYIAEILSYKNFECYTASNGRLGLEIAEKKSPDVVLCDILMPVMDGFDVLKELHSRQTVNTMVFIYITALTDRKNYRQGMELGADDYLTKPFTREELLQAIASRLNKHQRHMHYYQKITSYKKNAETELGAIQKELDEKKHSLKAVRAQMKLMNENLNETKAELMREMLNAAKTGNMLSSIQQKIKNEMKTTTLPPKPKQLLTELYNKINQQHIVVNNWTNFQIKFNQVYPGFVKKLVSKYSRLTHYEIVFISAHLMGLSTGQIADLLNISVDSVRKSRYRVKKKLGLKKGDDFLHYIYSINFQPEG